MLPKASIIILTYNHERYVEQTLDSILNQKINFPIQIIVADDGSNDKTLEIVKSYRNQHQQITLLEHVKNEGVLKNVFRIFPEIKSKYIALLDGDDCWTNEHKLQKQVNFLEQNSDYSACFHDAKIVHFDAANTILFNSFEKYSENYCYPTEVNPWDLLNRLIIPTSSMLLRTTFIEKENLNLIVDDYSIAWKLSCLAIKRSKFFYFKKTWSIYRNHPKGISKKRETSFHLSHVNFLKSLLTDDHYSLFKFELYKTIVNEYQNAMYKMQEEKVKPTFKLRMDYIKANILKTKYFLQKMNAKNKN